ncbi:Uncharacterized protein YwbO 2 [Colletotrichum chlorophyti]|uniref:Uncharacterized protein YwbO 2 n=1 Tax=Colletotrichum chlorophyti TaxID=708187 RepID=A0A1Q8RPL8_9PEZI|nr:Uncharacterized protein YwbO 2 [Colletotrichum chlorophyti]
MTIIKIEAVSDMLCPFCYVGKKNLDNAIELYRKIDPSAEFEVEWKPFYLSPAMKPSGYEKRAIYKDRFFVNGNYDAPVAHVVETCRRAGIDFKISGRTGNSRQSHKLLALALTKDNATQERLLEALFRGHFQEGADISDREFLLAAAVEAGLDEVEAAAVLESGRAGQMVDDEVIRARRAGITGVPTFTVQGRWRVGGNQDPDVFLRVFERVAEGP